MSKVVIGELTAAELLQKAADLYRSADTSHRDTMIAVGCMLHDFIVARIREGDGWSAAERQRRKFTREWAVRDAGKELGMTVNQVSNSVKMAMTAKLLGGDRPLKRLGYNALKFFGVFLDRRGMGGRPLPASGDFTLSEQWYVREGMEDQALALFARAVGEGWTNARVMEEVRPFERKYPARARSAGGRGERKSGADATASTQRIDFPVKAASAGDLVESILGLVEKAADPREVALLLQARLQPIIERRRRCVI